MERTSFPRAGWHPAQQGCRRQRVGAGVIPVWMVLKPSMIAATTIASAPRSTFAIFLRSACLSSPNKRRPHKIPTRELVFQRGKAIVRPTSRIANTVRVLATAHNAPARMAQTIKCLFSFRSTTTERVPLSNVGMVHRAIKTPETMHNEIANGENPEFTSLVGASAAPSHTPAARPQSTPMV